MALTQREAFVVGGGVIGTTTAFRLAQANWRVSIFDPAPGTGATWAAAGMVAATAEIAPGEEENYLQQRTVVQAWRSVARDLFALTGEELQLVENGTLLVGLDAGDRRLVDQFELVATRYGATPRRVTRASHGELFEGVTPRVGEGLLLSGDAWLNPDQAMDLMRRANELLGVRVVREQVLSATTHEDQVEITTSEATYRADLGILATGADALPLGVREKVRHVVRPVRGMTVRVQGLDRSSLPTLRAYDRGRTFYMVSRPGGYCVLGASSDEQKDLRVELGELQRLLRDALDVVPALEAAAVLETRQGLRPASSDLVPFFEIVQQRWGWSSGHYRHGVTLAPLAASSALDFAGTFS